MVRVWDLRATSGASESTAAPVYEVQTQARITCMDCMSAHENRAAATQVAQRGHSAEQVVLQCISEVDNSLSVLQPPLLVLHKFIVLGFWNEVKLP